MPDGYWISPDGKTISAVEHFDAIKQKPKTYGLTEQKIKGRKREDVLLMAMKNEWIRVRGHGSYTTFEGWNFNEWFLARVRKFLDKEKAWDNEAVVISDLKTGKYFETNVGALRSKIALAMTNPYKRSRIAKDLRFEDLWHKKKRLGRQWKK